jgi:hypothetical protein
MLFDGFIVPVYFEFLNDLEIEIKEDHAQFYLFFILRSKLLTGENKTHVRSKGVG